MDLADMPGVPVRRSPSPPGPTGQAIIQECCWTGMPRSLPRLETVRGVVVAGTPEALNRVRRGQAAGPSRGARRRSPPAKDAPLQVAIAPGNTLRRVIEESMPVLPPQLGGGPITDVSKGLRWASFAMDFEPKATLRVLIQAKDADAAKNLEKLAQTGLGFAAKSLLADKAMGDLSKAIEQMKPQSQGDRVTMDVDLEKAASLVAIPLDQAREAARRSQCVNNLKHIGLAMHNYYSANDTLPPAFKATKDGKPLLSWRVLVLPWLEQKALYDQFHLDEPWDSPHNKALISQMPAVYACPSGSKALAAEGKTCYLTPRGDGTMFPGAEGVSFRDVTDGLSNTFMVVEANDSQAVIWTKPDDWEVPPASKPETLFGHHPKGTNVLFGDGAVRFIKETILPKVLDALLTRKGGEVINAEEF